MKVYSLQIEAEYPGNRSQNLNRHLGLRIPVVSKTSNGVTGNCVTGFFFFFDAVGKKKVNKDVARAGSCYERKRRQNFISSIYTCKMFF